MKDEHKQVTTTDAGIPAASDEHSLTAGPGGPTVVVHAKGSGAHGFFEVTEDSAAGAACRDVMSELDRAHLVANIVGHLGRPELSSDVLLRAVDYWRKVDLGVGNAVSWGLGLEPSVDAA